MPICTIDNVPSATLILANCTRLASDETKDTFDFSNVEDNGPATEDNIVTQYTYDAVGNRTSSDADTFDFSNVNPDGGVPAATLLLPHFAVDLAPPSDSGGIADVEFFFADADDVPLSDTPIDTTFGDDFIA